MSEPATPDFTACPYWGQGGRYVVDPATGQRIPVTEGSADPVEPPLSEVQESPGTGEVMTAIEGNTLVGHALPLVAEKPVKKGQ